ncbi:MULTISPECIES: deoxyuridine 5'-triphosphate nucleotidohydrolase [unclassified Archaeoglobus]|jgi:dUTP pyrophosphatase|uniref:deoxyuridine 5'-triphosphate nucleotidohydrolase n=1 Tax=unclassified Archaeoglobus TaxID=2643606 RepID=UPI0025BF8A92|nr:MULTISPECIES: deoxyuridine 5'-triphosphate nucleotidohydrolase [unclassified Archaeoglobus]
MAVLSAEDIRKRIIEEGLIRDYIDLETQLQPNGFDCTLKGVAKLRGCGRVDFDNSRRELPELEEIEFRDWVYLPKGVYRAYLNEVVKLGKDIMAIARPRSSLVRCGANILTAVWDAGYEGRSEVGIVVHNEYGIWLSRNARIVQLVFIKLTSETEGYRGVYRGENL